MSSGGKSGSNTTNEYHGTLAGALGEGPASSLQWIICGGKTVWSGGLAKPSGADYSDIDLVGVGKARFYWGTDTQNPDPILNSYEDHPAYRGWVYIVLIDCSFGSNGETDAPTIEVGWRRFPNQTIISGSSSAMDGGATSNPVTVGAELLTSWSWGGQPASRLNAASFQATADAMQAETVAGTNRIQSCISPLWNEQTDLKSALADIYSVSKVWLRQGVDGRIEAGRWRRDGSVTDVAALTVHDVDSENFSTDKIDALPNSFSIEFRDASKHHKTNAVSVDNTASIRSTGITRRQTAQRPMLIWQDQAISHGADLLREASVPKTTLTIAVRRSKAINPDGTPIRPGDYFTYPIEIFGDTPDTRLFRCVRREFDPTGPITLTGEMEINGAIQVVPFSTGVAEVAPVTPPVAYARILALSPETTDDKPGVGVFVARPSDLAFMADVQYCATPTGDFGSIGTQVVFSLPLTLVSNLASGGSTVRIALMTGPNGENLRRDQNVLLNWNGGDTEGRDDKLVLVLVQKDGSGNVTATEIVSVNGPATAVATDTYDIPVLRGRRGTSAAGFTAGTWANCEVWCVPLNGLESYVHPDLEDQIASRANAYFQLTPYAQSGAYDPALAHAERDRLVTAALPTAEFTAQTSSTDHVPLFTFLMPANRLTPLYSAIHGFVALAFIRATSAPATPTGGSYIAPTPAGWSAGTPAGTNPLWMSQRRFTPTGVGQDAAWSTPVRLEGVDGIDGGFVDYIFQRDATQPATPTGDGLPSGWSDGPPSGTNPLWMSNGLKDSLDHIVGVWSTPVRLDGTPGADGASIFVEYSVDGATSWHSTFTTGDIYMRQKVGVSGTWSSAIRIVGEQGPTGPQGTQGIQGPAGSNGATTYFHIAYANSSDGSVGFNQTSGAYVGTYVDTNPTDSVNYHDYTWRQFVGSQGATGTQGIPGVNGADGQTSYLHIKYSDDGGATFTASSGETPGDYIGTYVDFNPTDSTSVSAYTWAKIKGDTGAAGQDGVAVRGTINGSSTVTLTGSNTSTTLAVTVSTPTTAQVFFSGSLTNNGSQTSTFAAMLYIDGSAASPAVAFNTSSLATGQSQSFQIIATITGLSAGSHTFRMYATGYPESVTLAGTLTVQ